jgi:hypothetical protein
MSSIQLTTANGAADHAIAREVAAEMGPATFIVPPPDSEDTTKATTFNFHAPCNIRIVHYHTGDPFDFDDDDDDDDLDGDDDGVYESKRAPEPEPERKHHSHRHSSKKHGGAGGQPARRS